MKQLLIDGWEEVIVFRGKYILVYVTFNEILKDVTFNEIVKDVTFSEILSKTETAEVFFTPTYLRSFHLGL